MLVRESSGRVVRRERYAFVNRSFELGGGRSDDLSKYGTNNSYNGSAILV